VRSRHTEHFTLADPLERHVQRPGQIAAQVGECRKELVPLAGRGRRSCFEREREAALDVRQAREPAAQSAASNCVIGPTPDSPASTAVQVDSGSSPSGVTAPKPVTTTRLHPAAGRSLPLRFAISPCGWTAGVRWPVCTITVADLDPPAQS
jgi:hypothetical protein